MPNNLDVLDAASVLKTVATTEDPVTFVHTPHQLFQPLSLTMTQTNPVISNLASTAVVAANATRKFLLIQNNDAVNEVYVDFAGGVATAAGFIIAAGGSYQWDTVVGNQAVNAIAALAPVTLTVLEG